MSVALFLIYPVDPECTALVRNSAPFLDAGCSLLDAGYVDRQRVEYCVMRENRARPRCGNFFIFYM